MKRLIFIFYLQLELVVSSSLRHDSKQFRPAGDYGEHNDDKDLIEAVFSKGRTSSELLSKVTKEIIRQVEIEFSKTRENYDESGLECEPPISAENRGVIRDPNKRWYPSVNSGGYYMPIIFNESYTRDERAGFILAVKDIEAGTCLRFSYHDSLADLAGIDYVEVRNDGVGCWTQGLGRRGIGGQVLNLNSTSGEGQCRRKGTIIHETLHAVGLIHQHNSPGRDLYVNIIKVNIQPGELPQFAPYTETIVESFGVPYDYGSIMHYSRKASSRNGEDTIVPKQNVEIGQRIGLSAGDLQKINKMHNCPVHA